MPFLFLESVDKEIRFSQPTLIFKRVGGILEGRDPGDKVRANETPSKVDTTLECDMNQLAFADGSTFGRIHLT